MGVMLWLADKSALAWLAGSPDRAAWNDRVDRGLVRISTPTRLEIGFSARGGKELRMVSNRRPVSAMPVEHLTPAAENRAIEVQVMLADRGQHRAPSVPDLLVAAVAEATGLVVLHVDKDFELIAEVTGQPVERLRLPD